MNRETAAATEIQTQASRVIFPVDWIILSYSLLMIALIAALGRPLNTYFYELFFYISTAALTVAIVRTLDVSQGGWKALLRLLYPALLFTFFYRTTGGLMHLVYPEFFDAQLVAFEKQILGFNPTLVLDQTGLNPWIGELLLMCYGSYYLMLPVFLIPLFVRRDFHVIKEFLAAASLMFFASYLLFFLYPVLGPRWFFASDYLHEVQGPVFDWFVDFVQELAAVRGGAMPSSHTGVALILMIFCLRYYRRVGLALIPVIVGLAAGAIWGRYHYLSDVIVGALIGLVAVIIVWRYFGEKQGRPSVGNRMGVSHVS